MPLPPALAARLARRGLLKETPVEIIPEPPPPVQQATAEEVIAENYDDPDDGADAPYDPETHLTTNLDDQLESSESNNSLVYESLACPNRWNSYHICSAYCEQRYGIKSFRHDPSMERKRAHLLRRYPVPKGCIEVGDPDTGRFYYWNTETDEVSWLPPQHPRAVISLPADRLRELVVKSGAKGTGAVAPKGTVENSEGESEDDSTDLDDEEEEEDDLDEEKDFEQLEKEVLKRKKQSEEDRGFVKKRKDTKLDPMDPAAYSDIPKGGWSSGLEHRGTAKTGVDVTVSGPLFQQRPYPSPGAVLRMNDGGAKKK